MIVRYLPNRFTGERHTNNSPVPFSSVGQRHGCAASAASVIGSDQERRVVDEITVPAEQAALVIAACQVKHMIRTFEQVFPTRLVGVAPFVRLVIAGQHDGEADPGIKLAQFQSSFRGDRVEVM